MDNLSEIIGQNLKSFREKFRLSQEEISAFIGVKREVISYYENGSRNVPIENLQKFADLFGVELVEFYEEDAMIRESNKAFAFRKEEFLEKDLKILSEFHRIIKNYIKLQNLLKEND